MQAPFNNIVQHLFHQPSLHSVTVDELENMADQHPYFAAAHFLLLKKMQDTDHPLFNKQLHKTTLYFNNPLWLQYLLQPETVSNFTVSEKAPFITAGTAAPEADHDKTEAENITDIPATISQHTQDEAVTEAPEQLEEAVFETTALHTAEPAFQQTHGGIMEVITDVFHENTDQTGHPFFEKETDTRAIQEDGFTTASPETAAVPEPIAGNIAIENGHHILEEPKDAAQELTIAGEPDAIPEESSPAIFKEETIAEINPEAEVTATQTAAETPVDETVAPVETAPGTIHEEETDAHKDEAAATGAITAEINTGTTHLENSEIPGHPDETDIPAFSEPVASQEEKPLIKTIVETAAAKNDFLFEPYHTVDYFASQGIKLSKIEIDSKDRLGRQLKSFTEWLKTMKKLPQVSIDKILSENEESKVVADARHSIENKEVITEAMAEVFEKQGLAEKAVEVYQKLSLQNPAKSAYFAAKIEELKH